MSAYVCNDETLNRILAYIRINTHFLNEPDIRRVVEEHTDVTGGVDALATPEGQQAFCDRLRAANQNAVNQRYKEKDDPPSFHLTTTISVTTVQALKTVDCLLYQCSEGNVPEGRVCAFLTNLSNTLAHMIASRTPEYQETDWG